MGCIGIFIFEYYVFIVVYCVYSGFKWNFDDFKELKVFILWY